MPWHGNTPPHLTKQCDVAGCDLISFFHGFGRDLCRNCYNLWVSVPAAPVVNNQLELFPELELPKFGPRNTEIPNNRKSA